MYRIIIIAILSLFLACSNSCQAKSDALSFEGKGYVGTLPDLTNSFGNSTVEKQSSPDIRPAKDFNSENELKPVPKDNPAFVNIILKTDKTSQYANDINEFVAILENINDLIDNNSNVQVFNAKIYYFNKNAEYFRDKYVGKPESQFETYRRILDLSMHSKSIALLRTEAEIYNPYLAYQEEGYIYNPTNIKEQLDFLRAEIQQTILLLRESNHS